MSGESFWLGDMHSSCCMFFRRAVAAKPGGFPWATHSSVQSKSHSSR